MINILFTSKYSIKYLKITKIIYRCHKKHEFV